MCTCTCRFGAYLVQEELAQAGDVLTVFFAILIGAFVIGQAGPNLQKLVQAQAAGGAVYEVIDRVSEAMCPLFAVPDQLAFDL